MKNETTNCALCNCICRNHCIIQRVLEKGKDFAREVGTGGNLFQLVDLL